MEWTILHLYPELMSLYGEYANLSVLSRLLEDLGDTVTVRTATFEDTPDFSGADLVYMGAGTERSQKAVLTDLARHAGKLKEAVERGRPWGPPSPTPPARSGRAWAWRASPPWRRTSVPPGT